VLIEFQRKLMGDRGRNELFEAAIKRFVQPDRSVVLDIGAGTGFLSFLAARLGAKRCHLVEHSEILGLARRLARANRIPNLEFHACHSTELKTFPVDLIISETLGNHALEEDIVETMNDALRFLRPGGKISPMDLEQFVVPVIGEAHWRDVNVWDSVGYDLDYALAKDVALSNLYVRRFEPQDLLGLSEARSWDRLDFSKRNTLKREGVAKWKLGANATIYGYAIWWKSRLAEDVELSTAPDALRTHWDQVFLPLRSPLTALKGDEVEVRLACESTFRKGFWQTWATQWRRAGKVLAREDASTRNGRL